MVISISDVARQVEFDNELENDIFALYQTNRENFHEEIGTNIEGSSAVIIPPKGILTWGSEQIIRLARPVKSESPFLWNETCILFDEEIG